jgi:hypothetical protein
MDMLLREAEDPMTTAEELRDLARCPYIGVRKAVARNPATPSDILQKMAIRGIFEIQEAVMMNPSLADGLLLSMLGEFSCYRTELWGCVLGHHMRGNFLSTHILCASISGAPDYVRDSFARAPETPVDVLRVLAKDAEWQIRCSVGENPTAPPDVLLSLAEDLDSHVSQVVLERFPASAGICA